MKPYDRFIELRYLHCDGTAVKGAQFHIRAAGFTADGTLDSQGFVHLGGVPPLAGFNYWFDKDPQPYQPAGPKLASSVGAAAAQAEVDGVLDWLWGTLQGDFNSDPSLGQIAVNTLLGLVPLVDQALDVRDLIARLKNVIGFYMEGDAEQAAHEASLGLPYEAWLRQGLRHGALKYDATLDRDDPLQSGFPDAALETAFQQEGAALAAWLQQELGSDYSIFVKHG